MVHTVFQLPVVYKLSIIFVCTVKLLTAVCAHSVPIIVPKPPVIIIYTPWLLARILLSVTSSINRVPAIEKKSKDIPYNIIAKTNIHILLPGLPKANIEKWMAQPVMDISITFFMLRCRIIKGTRSMQRVSLICPKDISMLEWLTPKVPAKRDMVAKLLKKGFAKLLVV